MRSILATVLSLVLLFGIAVSADISSVGASKQAKVDICHVEMVLVFDDAGEPVLDPDTGEPVTEAVTIPLNVSGNAWFGDHGHGGHVDDYLAVVDADTGEFTCELPE